MTNKEYAQMRFLISGVAVAIFNHELTICRGKLISDLAKNALRLMSGSAVSREELLSANLCSLVANRIRGSSLSFEGELKIISIIFNIDREMLEKIIDIKIKIAQS